MLYKNCPGDKSTIPYSQSKQRVLYIPSRMLESYTGATDA